MAFHYSLLPLIDNTQIKWVIALQMGTADSLFKGKKIDNPRQAVETE
ncbi:Hypothetical protein ETEE_2967 [Edwardsiella anguillarum ET080813]|uniref:Uncharacterized protein n=1 Tax=Edwardsiella anguillarum ET080813 TaxID=667120 RepID=A0A076LN97_9GAMM|nr:Hypothetical protein ETEE_2967 [Edwardsiella anguillarum ET080813]